MSGDQASVVREAVILCGGLGTRLQGVIDDRPKALAEVLGRPFLEWIVRSLIATHGVDHIILATGYMGEMIERRFEGMSLGAVRLSYSHEPRPLGTGGALRLASQLTSTSRLLVLNGDSYCRFDLTRLLDTQIGKSAAASLWLALVHDQDRFGSVSIDADGRIQEFREKVVLAGPQLVSAGVYLIERNSIMAIAPNHTVSLERDVFPTLIDKGVYGVIGGTGFIDIGTPESLAIADSVLADELSM